MTDSNDATGSDMSSDEAREQFRRADALFDAALNLGSFERMAYVKAETINDISLRERVIALLHAHDESENFLSECAVPDALMRRLQLVAGETYRLRRRIAAGGMATVYLADDVRHERQVAIKVIDRNALPHEQVFSSDHARSAERFLTEIRVMARLQHPHLLPLFDSGASGGLLYYVMPFVKGKTLRERLKQESPLAVNEAIRIALVIAAAMQHAHSEGVVHRDLKPANILLRDGQPLVADFGIALAFAASNEQRMTGTGMLVGTVPYMSPEQALGEHSIDQRTDIYSLGAILYEMLTGDPPHVASTTASLLAKVRAERATSVHVLRESVSEALSSVIDRALAKRPVDRFQSMREFAAALTAANLAPAVAGAPSVRARSRWKGRAAGVGALAAAAVVALVVFNNRRAATTTGSRFVVAPATNAAAGRAPTITPDGASLVYAGSAETNRRIFIRNVNDLVARDLPGTRGVLSTFVSPDGKWIGFITDDDKLQRVPVSGGTPTVLAGVFRYSDAVWIGTDRIAATSYGEQGLSILSVNGGGLRPLTRLDTLRHDSGHSRPFVLPGERTLVFLIAHDRSGPGPEPGELAAVSLDTTSKSAQPVVRLGVQSLGAVGYVDGWLVYIALDGGGLMAVRFDADERVVHGEPIRVLEQADGGIDVATIASNGTLLYSRTREANMPLLVDSAGNAKPLLRGVSGVFMNPRLSPDGKRVAVQVTTKKGNDVWIYDLATSTPLHITESGSAVGPTWTPDGKRVVFFATKDGKDAAWSAATDGRSAASPLLPSDGIFAVNVSADGGQLIFQRQKGGVWSIWHANMVGDVTPRAFVQEKYDAFMPSLSPDGHWMAYAANESGRYEIYVRPFPGPGATVQVSRNGGAEPAWSRDGRKLFFRGDRRMYEANISNKSGIAVSNVRELFTDTFDGDMPMPHRNYDLTKDGRQFVMIGAAPESTPQTIVVLNWLNELRARLASAK